MIPEFLNPWMLLGLLLVGIPIAIHLLNRSRFRVERWGAMMFLAQAVQVRAQRIRLEQVLLLILRSLFVVLLALALGRPVTRRGGGEPDDPTTHVVVLDGSYSMNRGNGPNNLFQKAKTQALQIVERMKDGDNMLVITGGNTPRLLFPNLSFDRKFLRDKLEAVEPGVDQTLDMPKVLEQAYWRLERSSLPRHRLYLLTDGQGNGWRGDDRARWEKVAQHRELLKVKPTLYVCEQAPEQAARNLAVLRVYSRSPIVDTFRSAKFLVELANYGREKEAVHVEFRVDGVLAGERDAECAPGVSTVEFDHTFTPVAGAPEWKPVGKASWHHITASVDPDDLPLDNSLDLALEVRHAIPVLVVEGRESDSVMESDGGSLALALGAAGEPGQSGLFEVTRRTLSAFQQEIGRLDEYKTVILANVPSLSRDVQTALELFVEHGGGLLVALGDAADPEIYNRMSGTGRGMIPAELQSIRNYEQGPGQGAAKEKRPFRPSFPEGIGRDILDIFDTSRVRILSEVRVTKFWQVRPAEDATVLAGFDESPFLVYRHYGEGRVALWTTTLNSRWTNFPFTQDYLPLLQNLVTYLSASVRPPINLGQGETLVHSLPLDLLVAQRNGAPPEAGADDNGKDKDKDKDKPDKGGSRAHKYWTIIGPDGVRHKVETRVIAGRRVIEWQETNRPGIYTVKVPGLPPKYYAVALKPGEGDLAPLAAPVRRKLGETVVTGFVNSQEKLLAAIGTEEGAREWWPTLVFLGMILLCTELFLGWRFNG